MKPPNCELLSGNSRTLKKPGRYFYALFRKKANNLKIKAVIV